MTRSEMRARAEAMIEELISILDALDGDPDLEAETDLEPETDIDINPTSLQAGDSRPAKHIIRRRAA